MSTQKPTAKKVSRPKIEKFGQSLSAITIQGFKSISERRTMSLAALNVVAGANSSGKSSFMQPLLLLKQTLEASYDPGPLLINGPNVQFTELGQFFAKGLGSVANHLIIGIKFSDGHEFEIHLGQDTKGNLELLKNLVRSGKDEFVVTPHSNAAQLKMWLQKDFYDQFNKHFGPDKMMPMRDRSFIEIGVMVAGSELVRIGGTLSEVMKTQRLGLNILHVPGLRGQPDRRYQNSAVGTVFPGRMDSYVASIIAEWQDKNDERLTKLGDYLKQLGLTWKVQSNKVDATSVELKVGRLPVAQKGGARDLVSIADVGFGVSQVLPVLVALLVGRTGQLVYIEQPEIHLHPKAQRALAHVFADAIQSGSQVVVETHSALFVREIQTLVAKGVVNKSLVKLHWVSRNNKGDTDLQTCDLDDAGAYGNWPQDFDETESQAATDYYEAAEAVLFKS